MLSGHQMQTDLPGLRPLHLIPQPTNYAVRGNTPNLPHPRPQGSSHTTHRPVFTLQSDVLKLSLRIPFNLVQTSD